MTNKLLKETQFKELMNLTAKAQTVDMSDIVGVSNVSVNLAKKHLLNDLL